MSELLDFTKEGKHTKYFDCYVKCENTKYLFHRNVLCKTEYFDNFFNGKFELKKIDSVPMCSIPDTHSKYVSVLLNIIYTNKVDFNKCDIIGLIHMFDYISRFDIVCSMINQISDAPIDDLTTIIKYIKGKEKILTKCDYSRISSLFINKCIESGNFDVEKDVIIEYIDMETIDVKEGIEHIKIIEYLYKIKGVQTLSYFDIERVVERNSYNKGINFINGTLDYIIDMDEFSLVRNYLIMQYMTFLNKLYPDTFPFHRVLDKLK